jgi:lipopolysaccharide/colanic/teichoic acid biosynthesis glycosyltransferase
MNDGGVPATALVGLGGLAGIGPSTTCPATARMNWKVRVAKRTVDVVAAAVGLVLAAPLLPLVALAIKLDSRGPVLFRQRRAGTLLRTERVDGRLEFRFAEFDMLKFRTMRTDAERATGPVLATRTDPRVTRVGRFLRRTRLDELPQLWNVLSGQMSLVGPRPERPEILANLALAIPLFEERMRGVKPGITGLAQINLAYNGAAPPGSAVAALQDGLVNPFDVDEASGADADGMRLKLLFDLAYTATLDDLGTYLRTEGEIILKTPVVMLRGKGY